MLVNVMHPIGCQMIDFEDGVAVWNAASQLHSRICCLFPAKRRRTARSHVATSSKC